MRSSVTCARAAATARPLVLVAVAALLASLLVVGSPPPDAAAQVTQIFSSDEDGVGKDSYTTDEPVYGYVVTQVLRGGQVCATRPGSTECVTAKIPVPNFNSGAVPLFAPGALPPNNYRLIGFNQEGTTVTAQQLFNFSVRQANCTAPNPNATAVDSTICETNLRAFKNAASSMSFKSLLVSRLPGLVSLGIGAGIGARGGVLVAGGIGVSTTLGWSVGAVTGGLAFSNLSNTVAEHGERSRDFFEQLANDPPDPDFDTIAAPRFTTQDPPEDPLDRAYFEASDRQAAYAEAVLRAFERFQGAQEAGDGDAAKMQMSAASEFASELVAAMRDNADALRALAARAEATGGDSNPVISVADLDRAISIQQRIGASGFTQAELDELTSLGATPDGIQRAQESFVSIPFGDIPPGLTYAQHLRNFAQTTDNETFGIGLFAEDAAVVADLPPGDGPPPDPVAPTAAAVATPVSGVVPLDVSFDGSGSSDADGVVVSYEWDFGDGSASASGAQVSHTYTSPGEYTATLTVTDDDGLTDQATVAITVESSDPDPTNTPPVAVDDELTTDEGAAGSVDVLANDSDADGDGLEVIEFTQGLNGVVECTPAGVCTYTPAVGFSGNDSFTYVVSDGNGGTATATVAVTVVPTATGCSADEVGVTLSRALTGSTSGCVRGGDVKVRADAFGVRSVKGAVTVASLGGGGQDATVRFDLDRFLILPVHTGTVRVVDPAAGITATAVMLLGPLRTDGSSVSGRAEGVVGQWFALTPYRLDFLVNDLA